VVLLSNNQSPVTEFISKLNVLADKYKIVLFGLQSWMGYDNLDYDYLNNLSLHMPANNFIDYENNDTKKFIKKFRDNYKTEPEMYAYQGFDATYFFVSQLQKNGTGFLKTIQDNKQEGLETNYNFMQHPSDSGFENKYVYILKFKDYKLTRAN
jgi:ABC-type branched-subunit amino acid transport system substrate-binding protein